MLLSPLHSEVMTAGSVFEATIAARRPIDPILFRAFEWFGIPVTEVLAGDHAAQLTLFTSRPR